MFGKKIKFRSKAAPAAALLLVLLSSILFAGAAMGVGEKDFIVKSFSPKGTVEGRTEIRAVFNRDAVPAEKVGIELSASEMPFGFSPHIEGSGRWESGSVFVFHPRAGVLARATAYTATAKNGLRDTEGRPLSGTQSFSFNTPPLKFLGAKQADFHPDTRRIIYELEFSLPVSPARLRGYADVRDGKNRAVDFSIKQGPVSRKVFLELGSSASEATLTIAAGMPPEAGPLGLEKEEKVKLSRSLEVKVIGSWAASGMKGGSVTMELTAPVDFGKLSPFVQVSPKVPYTLEPRGRGFAVAGDFKPFDRVTVTLKKGLPSLGGKTLEREWSRSFIMPQRDPSVKFDTAGRVISPAGSLRIPIETVNIYKLRVTAFKLYENNIPIGMRSPWTDYPLDLSLRLNEKSFTVKGEPNEVVRRALDLKSVIGEEKGVFLIIAAGEEMNRYRSARIAVNVTDLGVTVKTGPDSALVWVNSVETGEPVRGADVTLWSWANQPVAKGKTNMKGIAEFEIKDTDADSSPVIATVSKAGDVSFVRLNMGLFESTDELNTEGERWLHKGYSAFCYMPRDIFRPGDTAPVRGVVRGADERAPKPFPVTVKVRTPNGKHWSSDTVKLTPEGTFSADVKIPLDAPVGAWLVTVTAPGSEEDLGFKDFYVEEFAAPRLITDVKLSPKRLVGDMATRLSFSAEYTFGGSASGLNWEAEQSVEQKLFAPEGWKGFVFADAEAKFRPESVFIGSGALDGDGEGAVAVKGRNWSVPSMAEIKVRVGVMEEGGRWTYKSETADWFPAGVMLGIMIPGDAAPEKTAAIKVAAVTPDGESADIKEVKYSLFRKARRAVTYEVDGRVVNRTLTELMPRDEGKAKVSDGVAEIPAELKEAGEYFIRVEEPVSGAKASASIYAYGYGGGSGELLPEIAEVTTDKKIYRVGDAVRAKVRAPFAGKLLYTVETWKAVQSGIIDMKGESETEIAFRVNNEMTPNAWLTVQVIRPAPETKESARAYGAAPIMLDNEGRKLFVGIDGAERLEPGENEFSISVKDSKGRGTESEVTVMLTDETVLGLTNWQSPDPYGFFTAKRTLGMGTYDLYSALITPETQGTPLLSAGGGAPADAMTKRQNEALSPVQARRFKIMSLIKTVRTDRNGECKIVFDVPEFAGKARLTAVAVTAEASGNSETAVKVNRDIVTEPALPRVLAPDDRFTAPVLIFNMGDAPRKVKLSVKTDGPVELEGDSEAEFEIGPGENIRHMLSYRAAGAGVARAEYVTEWDGGSSVSAAELPVRPAAPSVTESESFVLEAGESREVGIPGKWFPGTRRGRVMLSAMPAVTLADAARFLTDYPYNCLEQTVSAAWPLMLQPELMKTADSSLSSAESVKDALNSRITAIRAMQNYDGGFVRWPGQSWSQPWESLYGAHFFVEAGKAGIDIPEENVSAAMTYVRRLLSSAPSSNSEAARRDALTRRAYACYILALTGENQLGWIASLRDRQDELAPSGRLLLAAASAVAGQKKEAEAMLGGETETRGAERGNNDNYDSPLRDKALRLLALTHIDPSGPNAASAANSLLEALRGEKYPSTQEYGFSMLALGRWFKAQPAEGEPEGAIYGGGKELAKLTAGNRTVYADTDSTEPFKLENSGKSRLYGTRTVSGVPTEPIRERDEGIKLRQTLTDRSGSPVGGSVRRGEAVTSSVTVTPLSGTLRNVAVSIPVAAGFEIEGTVTSEGAVRSDLDEKFGAGASLRGVRTETRDDRQLIFIDTLAEPMVFKYKLRAVTAGRFTVPQMSAECMYNPAVLSVSGGGSVEIVQP